MTELKVYLIIILQTQDLSLKLWQILHMYIVHVVKYTQVYLGKLCLINLKRHKSSFINYTEICKKKTSI